MKKFMTVTLIALFCSQAFAANTFTIKSKDLSNKNYIKITESEKTVGFQYCNASNQCKQIGAKAQYSKAAIKKIKGSETLKTCGAIVADIAAPIVGAFAAATLAGVTVAGSGGGALVVMAGGGLAGSVTTAAAMAIGSKLSKTANAVFNPVYHGKKAHTAGKVLKNKDQKANNIDQFREGLETILKKA